ncbi:MAG: hypothetical protein AAGF47_04540 [Planctomycetota bacterium]
MTVFINSPSQSGAVSVAVESFTPTSGPGAGIPPIDRIANLNVIVNDSDVSQAIVTIRVNPVDVASGQTLEYIGSVSTGGSRPTWLGFDFNGDIGRPNQTPRDQVEANLITGVDISGSVFADMEANSTSGVAGNFNDIFVDGDIAGNLQCSTTGSLGPVECGGSQLLGEIFSPNDIRRISFGGTIRRVVAGDRIQGANVEAAGIVAPPGVVGLESDLLQGNLLIEGDVSAPIVISQEWHGSSNIARIDGDLAAGTVGTLGNRMFILSDPTPTVNDGADILEEQIIINAANNSSDWLGDVAINSGGSEEILIGPNQAQPYQAPYYEALPSELGGGAIGLVPFNFHPKASDPQQFDEVNKNPKQLSGTEFTSFQAVVEHYGPVALGAAGTPAFLIEHCIDPNIPFRM